MDDFKYFKYLNTRSKIGLYYKKFYLYPKIQKLLTNPVLDVGCGIGDYLNFNPKAIGIDINQYNIDFINKRNLKAFKMEVDQIPFKKNSFPSILMDNVLEHIKDPNKIILEMKRVLIPGGKLVIAVPGIKGFESDSDHKIFYTEKKLNLLLSEYGFRFVKTFIMPIEIRLLSKFLKSYCIYSLFENI